ncbi:hypothetical protein STEG23_035225 [Scotinomys teguina]
MRPLVLLWSCLVLPGYEALKGPKEISGFEGDKVSLKCTYEKKLRGHRKYWCRQGGIMVSRCTDIVYTTQNQEVAQGRMSIRDNPRDLSITVTMRDLTLKDAGKYWCGIDRLGFDESFEVSLIVFPADKEPDWIQTVLVTCLQATLIAFGSHMLGGERKPPGNNWVPEDAMINLAAPPECLCNPKLSAVLSTEIQHLSQTTEEEAATSLDAEEDVMAASPLQMSAEELAFSEFISV